MPHAVIETFVWLFGLCVGSFLNVVVYRLPAGLSIADPPRSFCPRCRKSIAWYDNLPILSWLLLRGRCRHCGVGISVQYPLVEGLTGLTFVLLYHLLFVADSRAGLALLAHPADTPLLLAWLVLVAGLVACSAMDIVSYAVDVRITNAVMLAGVVLHAVWPRGEFFVPRAGTPLAAAAVAALVVSAVMLWLTVWRSEGEDAETPDEAATFAQHPASRAAALGGRLGVLLFLLLAVWLLLVAAGAVPDTPKVAVPVCFAALFAATVLAGGQPRAADDEVFNAIEEEKPRARLTALKELAWLSPAVVAGAAAFVVVAGWPACGDAWHRLAAWSPGGGFAPVGGAAFAIHGAMVAAAAGWGLRIVFTLAFGREAFGVGDIYILAAAGAAGGWDIALLGLLLSVGIALAGWLLGLLLKSTVMIPFGPWLALGFMAALAWNRPAERIVESYHGNLVFAWQERPDLLLIVAGLMLVGTAAAIFLSRLVRRLIPAGTHEE